jgi:hypothetical protein
MNEINLMFLRDTIQRGRVESLSKLFADIYAALYSEGFSTVECCDALLHLVHQQKPADAVVKPLEEALLAYYEELDKQNRLI